MPVRKIKKTSRKRSADQRGVTKPANSLIIVRPPGDELIAGYIRYLAKEAGFKTIEAEIIPHLSDEDALQIRITQRSDTNPLQFAALLKRWTKLPYKMSYSEIGSKLGMEKQWVEQFLRLLKAPDPVKDALKKGEIKPSHAREIIKAPLEMAKELVKYSTGKSVKEVKAMVNDTKNAIGIKPLSAKGRLKLP